MSYIEPAFHIQQNILICHSGKDQILTHEAEFDTQELGQKKLTPIGVSSRFSNPQLEQ